MSDNEWPKSADMLDRFALKARLNQEVARTRRHGGFLSVAAIGFTDAGSSPDAHECIERVAEVLREGQRIHDVVGWRGWATIVVLMPDSDMSQALQGAERLLGLARKAGVLPPGRSLAAGVAAGYGEIEGGAQALLDAAEHALSEADTGQVKPSDVLNGQPKVLVVDDDTQAALSLAEAISEAGWEGNPCTDSSDALERVREVSYSAIFVALSIKGRGGIDILRESLARHPQRPCVLMSGSDAQNEDVMEALGLGPVMFIRKPVSRKDLDTALRMFRSRLPGLASQE